jgi:hypothetical protein
VLKLHRYDLSSFTEDGSTALGTNYDGMTESVGGETALTLTEPLHLVDPTIADPKEVSVNGTPTTLSQTAGWYELDTTDRYHPHALGTDAAPAGGYWDFLVSFEYKLPLISPAGSSNVNFQILARSETDGTSVGSNFVYFQQFYYGKTGGEYRRMTAKPSGGVSVHVFQDTIAWDAAEAAPTTIYVMEVLIKRLPKLDGTWQFGAYLFDRYGNVAGHQVFPYTSDYTSADNFWFRFMGGNDGDIGVRAPNDLDPDGDKLLAIHFRRLSHFYSATWTVPDDFVSADRLILEGETYGSLYDLEIKASGDPAWVAVPENRVLTGLSGFTPVAGETVQVRFSVDTAPLLDTWEDFRHRMQQRPYVYGVSIEYTGTSRLRPRVSA